MINYEAEVKKVYPDAVYMYFENSEEGKHQIRVYTGEIPQTLGASWYSEYVAWMITYSNLKQQGKL